MASLSREHIQPADCESQSEASEQSGDHEVIQHLVEQLDCMMHSAHSVSHDAQLAVLWNLQDAIKDDKGDVSEEHARSAVDAGAKHKLRPLLVCEDAAVRSSAHALLEKINDVMILA